MIYTKDAKAEVKAVGTDDGLEEYQFKALISVFNVIDSYGDVVMPGAFADDLNDWRSKGAPIPTIWSHQWTDIWSHIGGADPSKATETPQGLVVVSDLDPDNPTAMQAYKLMKARRITQFSFGFDVLDGGWGTRATPDGGETDVYELRKLHLHEVGPCLVGVNRATELQGIKGTPPPREKSSPASRKADEGGSATRPISGAALSAWATIQEMQGVES